MRHTVLVTRLGCSVAFFIIAVRCTDAETQAGGQTGAAGQQAIGSGAGSGGGATSGSGAASGGNAAIGSGGSTGSDGAGGGTAEPNGEDGGVDSSGNSGMPGGAAGAPAELPPDDGLPTWSGIYNYEFRSCKNPTCHGRGVAGVDMTTKQAAYDSLVGQTSDPTRECAMLNFKRVEPNEPDRSLLQVKLQIDTPCGQQMPPGGSLSDKALDRVRAWIMAGAKND